MRSVAVWPDYGAGPSATVSSQVFDLDDAGDDAGYAPDRTLTLTSIVAFFVFALVGACGLNNRCCRTGAGPCHAAVPTIPIWVDRVVGFGHGRLSHAPNGPAYGGFGD